MKLWFILWLAWVTLIGCQSTHNNRSHLDGVTVNHKAADINMRLGLQYMEQGDYVTALQKLEKSLKQNPQSPATHNTLALLYNILGKTRQAEHHFKQSVRYNPDYSEAQNNFGVFLCEQARYFEAEKRFLLAIQNPLYASPAQAAENAGICLSKIPDFDKAEGYFQQALRINPIMAQSIFYIAKISYQKRDMSKAKFYIDRYRLTSEWNAESLLLAARIARELGDQDAVASYILLLKGKFPESDEALEVMKGW